MPRVLCNIIVLYRRCNVLLPTTQVYSIDYLKEITMDGLTVLEYMRQVRLQHIYLPLRIRCSLLL